MPVSGLEGKEGQLKRGTTRYFWAAIGWLMGLGSVVGCSETPFRTNSLNPQGPAAARIADLWWLILVLGTGTFLVVMALLAWGLWRKRPDLEGGEQSGEVVRRRSRRIVVGGGIIFPAVVLTVVFGFTLSTLANLNGMEDGEALVVEVVGHQWWWEVGYPNEGFVTANEIHIPVGEPVQFRLGTADVIHSFWVPALHGKMDLVPGQTNIWWLEADEAGEYWGLCAEFCGIQHAKMLFVVVAEPRAEFDAWLAGQQEAAQAPTEALTEEGFLVFMNTGCNDCHTVRGTAANGELGPDLTHFASRLTIAAGVYPNTRDNLRTWILDPHSLKDGNLMPSTSLSEAELEALLAYLESLE